MRIHQSVKAIDLELEELKGRAQDIVDEVTALLKKVKPQKGEALKNQPKKLWVRLKEVEGYPTFSIVWSQVNYYHGKTGRLYTKDLTRGNNYKIMERKFVNCTRGYPVHVQKLLWSYEERFAKIRKQVSQMSRARENLLQYLKELNQVGDIAESGDQ